MPYVNIPDSGLGGAVAKIVGKIQGKISAQVLSQATKITNKLNTDGCPGDSELSRLRNQKQQLEAALSSISNKLSKFKSLPGKLKGPLSGLKAALKIILSLPIPQSVPPGFGLPINITTKYADLMHLLKEFIKQIDELIQSVEVVLDTPTSALDGITSNLNRTDNALRVCELESALGKEINKGNISEDQLKQFGLLDSSGVFTLSKANTDLLSQNSNIGIGRDKDATDERYRGKWQDGVLYRAKDIVSKDKVKYNCRTEHTSDINGGKLTGPPPLGPWNELGKATENAINDLNISLTKLSDSGLSSEFLKNLRSLLDNFKTPSKGERDGDGKFYHTGPDGTVYVLEILVDPNSPQIAPRRFAIASTLTGITKLKGPKSFSSSVEVLLDEIKFRIDNQLP